MNERRTSQKIVINGKEYASPEEMPPDIRAVYERATTLMADEDANGVPDFLEGKGPTGLWSASKEAWQIVRDARHAGIESVDFRGNAPGGPGRLPSSALRPGDTSTSTTTTTVHSGPAPGRSSIPSHRPPEPEAIGSFSARKVMLSVLAAALVVYALNTFGVLG